MARAEADKAERKEIDTELDNHETELPPPDVPEHAFLSEEKPKTKTR